MPLSKICGVIDVQGFQLKDRFVARELAIVSRKFSQGQEINPRINEKELSKEDQYLLSRDSYFMNGCSIKSHRCDFLFTSEELHIIINDWYDIIATEDKPYIGYHNEQIWNILLELGIPCVNLNDSTIGFPTYAEIEAKHGKNKINCTFHARPVIKEYINEVCAYRKAIILFQVLNEMQETKADNMEEVN